MYLQKNFVFTKKSKNLAKYRSENSLDYQIGLSKFIGRSNNNEQCCRKYWSSSIDL